MLEDRSLEAARRQTDNTFYLAMVREQGERALENGDRAGATAAWGRMLEIVVSPPKTRVKSPRRSNPAAPVSGRCRRRRRRRGRSVAPARSCRRNAV